MKNVLNFLLFLAFNFLSAQVNPSVNTTTQIGEVTSSTTVDNTSVIIQNNPSENQNIQYVTGTYINENLTMLSDDLYAKQIDDYWFNEMRNSSLNADNQTISNYVADYDELSTEILKQRLQFLNSKTPFNVEYNASLERIIKKFLKNRKDKYASLIAKSKYYFPLIEEQLAKYNIPIEMKYLAVIESALNPRAKSKMGASGLWQFMYATGKQYKLNVNSYVDERHDVLKATEAACQFLSSLYNTFGDWDLALAAYNSGPGNVSKAIRRSGGSRNYWNIRHHLPRETASYVPLFYTTMYIFEYADIHQIFPTEIPLQHFETDSLTVRKQISFDQITQAIPITKKTLEFLNPQYKLGIIPVVKGKNYKVILPKNLIGQFVQNEDRIYAFAVADDAKREKPLPKFTEMSNRIRYKVKSGDNLSVIARQYRVTVSKIKRWNNLKSNKLKIGQRLIIFPRR